MKILSSILMLGCLAGTAIASDMALDIKLNGREIETGQKSSHINMSGILIIEDIDAETNAFTGSLIIMDVKKPHWEFSDRPVYYWPWGWFWMKYVRYYEDPVKVDVRLILNKNNEFGMIVDMEGAALSGIGHLVMNKKGVQQAVISSGHGAFMYNGYYEEDPVVTNALTIAAARPADDDAPVMELEVGKMSALLNKSLTDELNDSDDDFSIEEWLENHNFRHSGKHRDD